MASGRALRTGGGGGPVQPMLVSPGRGGGSGVRGGTLPQQAHANPSPVTATTPVNPMEKEAYDRSASYESGLADLTNQEIQRELGRARDELSVGMSKEGEAAMSRGADPTLFRSRALAQGKRDIHSLQGQLADVALGRREGALQQMTSAAGQAASGQRTLHLGTLAARTADQRTLLDQADLQSRIREKPYERLLDMFSSVAGAGMLGGGGGSVGSGILGGRLGRSGGGLVA